MPFSRQGSGGGVFSLEAAFDFGLDFRLLICLAESLLTV